MRLRKILGRVQMGRVGTPEEIGWACVFLASPAASYVTGQTLIVDGGRLAGSDLRLLLSPKDNVPVLLQDSDAG